MPIRFVVILRPKNHFVRAGDHIRIDRDRAGRHHIDRPLGIDSHHIRGDSAGGQGAGIDDPDAARNGRPFQVAKESGQVGG